MDFIYRLVDSINSIQGLKNKIRTGYLNDNESLVIYPLAGSRTVQQFYDGVKEQELNYEITMKSKDGQKLDDTLWQIQNYLEQLTELNSQDDSFDFDWLEITNKPFIEQFDEQGWFVFSIDFKAHITIY